MRGILLTLFTLFSFLFLTTVVFATEISDCSVLDSANTEYTLTSDIINTSSNPCIDITANNITLDCQGHLIDGIGSPTFQVGIGLFTSDRSGNMIKNCVISDMFMGIQMSSNNNTIYNVTGIDTWGPAIEINGNASIIHDITAYGTVEGSGMIHFSAPAYNNILYNTNSSQLLFEESSPSSLLVENNLLYNNIFNNQPLLVDMEELHNWTTVIPSQFRETNHWNTTYQAGTNIWNSSLGYIGGNFYSDYSNTCADENFDGFCDVPYVMNENNTDYLPIASVLGRLPFNYISDCSVLNVANTIYYLTGDIIDTSSNPCIQINAGNITLDCQGHLIDGINTGSFAIEINGNNNITVENCNITNWMRGIRVNGNHHKILNNTISFLYGENPGQAGIEINGEYFLIEGNTIYNTSFECGGECARGIFGSFNHTIIRNNTIYNTDSQGIASNEQSYYNTIEKNTISNSMAGMYLPNGFANSIVKDNYIYNTSSGGITLDGVFNVTISDNILYNSYIGIFLLSASNNIIINNTANNNRWGIILYYGSFNNSVINNTISNNTVRGGISIQGCENNTVKDNIITNSNPAFGDIYIYLSTNNAFYNNFINLVKFAGDNNDGCIGTETSCSNLQSVCEYEGWAGEDCCSYFGCGWSGSVCTGETSVNCFNEMFTASGECQYATNCTPAYNMPNYWNTTKQSGTNIWNSSLGYIGGNYWSNYSDTCADANNDGFCDAPLTLLSNNLDYLPIAKTLGYTPPSPPPVRFSTEYPLGGLLIAVLLPIVIGLFAYKLFSEKMEITLKGFVAIIVVMIALIIVAIGFSQVFGII